MRPAPVGLILGVLAFSLWAELGAAHERTAIYGCKILTADGQVVEYHGDLYAEPAACACPEPAEPERAEACVPGDFTGDGAVGVLDWSLFLKTVGEREGATTDAE